MELAPRPLRPAARGRDRQRTRRTTSEGQFRARIRASSNLAESFLSHDLSPSPSPNPPPPHISRLIVIAVIVVVVVSRGGRSFSPSQTRTTMQSVRDKSYFVLRVPLPAPPVIVAMDIYIFFLPNITKNNSFHLFEDYISRYTLQPRRIADTTLFIKRNLIPIAVQRCN